MTLHVVPEKYDFADETLTTLAAELADRCEDIGAVGGKMTFSFPEDHYLAGVEVALSVSLKAPLGEDKEALDPATDDAGGEPE